MYFEQIPDIKKGIEKELEKGNRSFILYPFGEIGMLTKKVLNECYGIQEAFIVDNHLAKYNESIKEVAYLGTIDISKYQVLIASDNENIYEEIREQIKKHVPEEHIVDLFKAKILRGGAKPKTQTKVGKYSYGPLCDNPFVEEVGAFCSFAIGSSAVDNHPIQYISTHVFLYWGGENDSLQSMTYEEAANRNRGRFLNGVKPRGSIHKGKKSVIGNDVWLGKNVIITNGANIGNGVIAGAGAVITKDVPDYAIVAGVPARIIRYRYPEEQIKALNEIAWWNWPDEKIRQCYDDFYEDIDVFIEKHIRD